MKKFNIYAIAFPVVAAILSLAACTRDVPVGLTGDVIRISASGSDIGTKAMLNADDIQVNGTQIEVRDYLTGFTGTIDGHRYDASGNDNSLMYISDFLAYNSGSWTFGQDIPWRWTRTGVHHFYGWLSRDKDGLTPASLWNDGSTNITFNPADNSISIPTLTMDRNTPQFDFSYSNEAVKDVESAAFKASEDVKLTLKHLFTAIGFSIQNSGNDPVNIVSVTLNGLNNGKSALISYASEEALLTLGTGEKYDNLLATWSTAKPLRPGGTKIDLITAESLAASADPACYLMWPQTAAEIFATDGPSFTVVYTIDGVMDPADETQLQTFTKTRKLKATGYFGTEASPLGIDAGKKYSFNLQFKAKSIDLNLIVMPWDYTEFDLDYSANSISARSEADNEGVMWLWTLTYDSSGHETWTPGPRDRLVTLESNKRIKGTFNIGSPSNGQWQITMYPAEAEHYFRIEPSTGDITEDLVRNQNGLVEFYIYPEGGAVPSQQVLHLNLAFRFNGESQWRDGNTEFNRKDWRVVREP